MLDGSAQGATAGVSVATRDALCRPQLQHEAYWGHFPRGADPPTNDPRATTLPIQFPAYLSLQAISAAGDGSRRAWEGTSGCRGPREVGRGGEGGEAKSEGWSGGSDATLDAETKEDGWGHTR